MDLINPPVAITYKDDGNQDGICSQLLRIYGIYAISRDLGIPYVHSPIAHLGYHGLAALEDNCPLPNLLADVNRVFDIPSDIELAGEPVTIHDMIDADVKSIQRIKNTGTNGRGLNLIRILYPFPVTDSNPELYRRLEPISPFPYRSSDVFRLAIHVRRGELFAVDSHWMLPNSYYVACALRFQEILRKLDIPFVCELYTEVPSKSFEVTPHHHGINGRIDGNLLFDPAMNRLEDFDAIPDLQRYINFDPIESLRRLATADALIISHSSFSYFPAVLNPDRVVVYHPYWRGRMKHWLTANDEGVFPEAGLTQRLKVWKRAAARARGIDAPRDPMLEVERLLEPFRRQSAEIRSVVTMGCHEILGAPEEAALLSAATRLCEASLGDDLLLIPVRALKETLPPLAEEFNFRAIAALFPNEQSDEDWKLRRSLFDRGLLCIGSVDFAGGQALCFLASDAVRSVNQLDVESRGHITMSTLVENAGFGNQLWRYAFLKLYALRHGLTPAIPAWQGKQLFGLDDESCEGFDLPRIGYPGFADNDRELWDREDPPVNVDMSGYFQEIPECWRRHRALLRRMFELLPEHAQAIEGWRNAVTGGGRRPLVAISVRRGDYGKFQSESWPWFRTVPEEWYRDWLRALWPTLRDPVLFVASDEPGKVLPMFQEFDPVPVTGGSIAPELPHHVSDFEVLRRADYVAICNSSFPRIAAVLAPSTQRCFLPSFRSQSFEPYEPWVDPAFWVRFADTWPRPNLEGKFEQSAVLLPPGRYVAMGTEPPPPGVDRIDGICIHGWRPPDVSGVRPSQSTAVLRFRAGAAVGSRISLVLRLAASRRDFRLRVHSGSGPDTEVLAPEGSNKVVGLTAVVESGNLVTTYLLTLAAMFPEPDGCYWMLQGILYFDAKGATSA